MGTPNIHHLWVNAKKGYISEQGYGKGVPPIFTTGSELSYHTISYHIIPYHTRYRTISYHIILARVTLYLIDETTLHDMLGAAWLTVALRIHAARLKLTKA